MHFKSQHINVTVENSIAMIEIQQTFLNETDEVVEATYMFPTDPDEHTVVSRVMFALGDKTVEGKVIEKQKAHEKYEDALASGNAAVMVEESDKDKDLLKMSIGGIQPAQEVNVRIQLLKHLEIEAGAYCLRVPTSYFIKFGNAAEGGPQVNIGVPISKVEPPKTAEYSFRIEINTQHPITYVSAPSHSKATKISKDIAQPQSE